MKPNNLQLLIILSVSLCMAAGSFSAHATSARSALTGPALVAAR